VSARSEPGLRAPQSRTEGTSVRFCDGCAEVITPDERAHRRYDRTRADVHTLIWPC